MDTQIRSSLATEPFVGGQDDPRITGGGGVFHAPLPRLNTSINRAAGIRNRTWVSRFTLAPGQAEEEFSTATPSVGVSARVTAPRRIWFMLGAFGSCQEV